MTPIKIRAKDIKQLDYAIRAFNAKITRTEKWNASAFEYLPKRVERSELWAMIATRKDYNRILKSLQRATKNKNAFEPVETQSGLRITRWEKQEFSYNLRRVNFLKKQELKKVEEFQNLNNTNNSNCKYLGKQLGTIAREKLGQFYHYDINNMNSKDWLFANQFTREASQDMFRAYRYTKYKQEYINKLHEVFERWVDLQVEVTALAQWLENQDPNFIYYAQLKYRELSLEWLYEMSKMAEKLQTLQYYWHWASVEWEEVNA